MKDRYACLFLCASLALVGCSQEKEIKEDCTTISLSEHTSFKGEGVSLNGNNVIINKKGVYLIKGTLNNGKIQVKVPNEEVKLIFHNTHINNPLDCAILLQEGNTTLSLAKGSKNSVSNGEQGPYPATIYAQASFSIEGEGSLKIIANNQSGIASEKNMTINEGNIEIKAMNEGISANYTKESNLIMNGGTLQIKADKDSINTKGNITLNGGSIYTFSSAKQTSNGIKCEGTLIINKGVLLASGGNMSSPMENNPQSFIHANFPQSYENCTITLKKKDATLIEFPIAKTFKEILFSSPNISEDQPIDFFIDDQLITSLYANKKAY